MTDIEKELAALKERGLTFGQCVHLFGVDRKVDPYTKAAFEARNRDGELEIDSRTVVSESDDGGAYVMAWVWVTDEEAGVKTETVNYYSCERCGHEWEGTYECQVDDDCPSCGVRHMTPYFAEDADEQGENEEERLRLLGNLKKERADAADPA